MRRWSFSESAPRTCNSPPVLHLTATDQLHLNTAAGLSHIDGARGLFFLSKE